MLTEKRYNLAFYPILAIISAYTFVSIFFLIISIINQHRNDMVFWTLNSVTSLFLFTIFSFIHLEIEKKYYNHSLKNSSRAESKKIDKYDYFMKIGIYIGTFTALAFTFIVILIPAEENVLSSILIWIGSLVMIFSLFLLIYGFSKSKVENSTD